VSLTSGYDNARDNKPFSGKVSLESTGDLLYMTGAFFSTYDNGGDANNWRLSLSRRDPEGEIFADDEAIRHTLVGRAFHDWKVRDVTFGDVFTPELPLTAKNKNGMGVYLSNQPFDRVTQFDRTILEGDILPNWDVELYRNDDLLAFQRAGADSRYTFQDVPLLSGLNIMRLVFHGPYGETREETRRVMVSTDLTKAGQSYFRMGVVEQGRVLSSMIPAPEGSGVGTRESASAFASRGGLRSFFDYEYGLRDNMALFGQLVHRPSDDGKARGYATGGVGASAFGVYGRVDGSFSDDGGKAVQALAQTNVGGITLTGRHQVFDNFISDFTESLTRSAIMDPVTDFTSLRADTPLDVSWLPRLNLGISGKRTVYKSRLREDDVTLRLSSSFGRMAASNNLSLLRYSGENDLAGLEETQTVGDLTLSMTAWGVHVRGGLHYDVMPRVRANTVVLTADKTLGGNLNLRGEMSRDLTGSRLTTFLAGLNRNFGTFQLGLSGTFDNEKRAAGFVNLAFSFGCEPVTDSWRYFADQTAGDGIITASAYLDKNGDGLFGEGDDVVTNVDVRSDGGGMATTDSNGMAMFVGQRTTARNNIALDDGSLGDPSWIVREEGFGVIARPGTPVHVAFAIETSGEVGGTVYLAKPDGTKTVATNVVMQLVDAQGKVVRETRSSFDGYYVFEKIRRGHYTLRVSPEQMVRRGLTSSAPVDIDIKGEGSVLGGIDFVVRR
jgi:hypothetical protein